MFIVKWWVYPARWWQFWYPQSGLPGGVIIGAIVIIAFEALKK